MTLGVEHQILDGTLPSCYWNC